MADPRFSIKVKRVRKGQAHPEVEKIQRYLTRAGYLRTAVTLGRLDSPTSAALRRFQQYFGLKETGELNAATAAALQLPRCDVPDVFVLAFNDLRPGPQGFRLSGCKYEKQTFTYRFANYTSDLRQEQAAAAVQRAFDTWASVLCGVTFQETTSRRADFTIGWFSGAHGDGAPFDGWSNTFGHAVPPGECGGTDRSWAGHIHLDEGDTWSVDRDEAPFFIDLETVALHEIGHALGLNHSRNEDAVMWAGMNRARRTLTQDDIDAIRRLYPSLCRRGDSGDRGEFVGEIAAVRHRNRQVVTAVQARDGRLKLIAWAVRPNGAVTWTGDSGTAAGRASWIAIDRPFSGSRYVTACRTSSGDLRLISWGINDAGTIITRQGDSGNQAGRASRIGLVSLNNDLWVTACRTSGRELRLIAWLLNADGSFTRLGDSERQAGRVSEIDMVRIDQNQVLTAVRTSAETLKLITWGIEPGGLVKRLGDSGDQAGASQIIKVVVDHHGHPVTAVRTSSGRLQLITWELQAHGDLQRLGNSGNLAGGTWDHDLAQARDGRLATAVRTEAGRLKVILWETGADGSVTRWGDSDGLARTATWPTLVEPLDGTGETVTCVRTSRGVLKLITWAP